MGLRRKKYKPKSLKVGRVVRQKFDFAVKYKSDIYDADYTVIFNETGAVKVASGTVIIVDHEHIANNLMVKLGSNDQELYDALPEAVTNNVPQYITI
jgi:hypothetical protein